MIVITPWGGVKEQTAGIYAQKLSKKGFVTLAFDHTSYGESEGVPRWNEDPLTKVEDIKSAVDFIKETINPKSISLLGICSGAAYAVYAAAIIQNSISSIATVSGYFHDLYQRKYLIDEIGKEATVKLIEEAKNSIVNYIKTGEVEYIPHVAINENSLEINKDFFSYYGTKRGQTRNYVCKTALASLEQLACFSSSPAIKAFSPKPCLFIVGSRAKSSYESEDAYSAMGNTENKELYIIKDANHTDLYDKEIYVNKAIEKLKEFYKKSSVSDKS